MKTSDVLIAAKALIATPDTWMQGDYTEVRNGYRCFCSLGAINKVQNREHGKFAEENDHACTILKVLHTAEITPGYNFADYNDNHTHDEVMTAFDKAITVALKNESEGE